MILNITPPSRENLSLHAIAYLDMLGTTSKIKKDQNGYYLSTLHMIFDMAYKYCNVLHQLKPTSSKLNVKVFSDNIVIAIPLDSKSDMNGFEALLSFVSYFQNWATVFYSWPVRGGITMGDLFLDDTFVWGTGLLRAYELECNIAVYPRIIVDRNIIHQQSTTCNFLIKDNDGQYYLDFLNSIRHENPNIIQSSFRNMLENIEKSPGTYEERPLQKLQWYRNYINSWYQRMHSSAPALFINELP